MNSGRAPIWTGLLNAACTVACLVVLAIAASKGAKADPVAVGAEHCVINVAAGDALNIRTGPGVGYQVLGGKPYGSCGVRITAECTGAWCPMEDGHYLGWVHRSYLGMVSPALYCVSGVAAWDVLNLRAYPSAGSPVLTALPPNQCDIAFLPYAVGGWQKVRVDGWEGWAARRYLSGQ